MNKIFPVIIALLLGSTLGFSQNKKELIAQVAQLESKTSEMQVQLDKMQAEKEVNLENEFEKFSYAFGLTVGKNLKTVGYDSLAYQAFAVALEDLMNGNEKMDQQEAQNHVRTVIQNLEEENAKKYSNYPKKSYFKNIYT